MSNPQKDQFVNAFQQIAQPWTTWVYQSKYAETPIHSVSPINNFKFGGLNFEFNCSVLEEGCLQFEVWVNGTMVLADSHYFFEDLEDDGKLDELYSTLFLE
jgi:hypothetical protein